MSYVLRKKLQPLLKIKRLEDIEVLNEKTVSNFQKLKNSVNIDYLKLLRKYMDILRFV